MRFMLTALTVRSDTRGTRRSRQTSIQGSKHTARGSSSLMPFEVQHAPPLAVPAQRPNVDRLTLYVVQQKELAVLVFGAGDRRLPRIEAWRAPRGVPLDHLRGRVHRLLDEPEALHERQEPLVGAGAHGVASQWSRYARRLVKPEYKGLASVVEHHGVAPDLCYREIHPHHDQNEELAPLADPRRIWRALFKELDGLVHKIRGRQPPLLEYAPQPQHARVTQGRMEVVIHAFRVGSG